MSGRLVLITGGAGFIGANLAHRLAASGQPVLIYDNLSRPGVDRNLAWLRRTHGDAVTVEIADIRDSAALRAAVQRAGQVFHLAAQVAVTTSLADPLHDFAVNAGGTLNLLEAVRGCAVPPPVVFTSTNKVYGAVDDLDLEPGATRYMPRAEDGRGSGIDETRPLDFHSPYGCSKGTADQYVVDYARSYGLPALVFRMSCIYGPHQFGTEDQGWVAHFLLRAIAGEPITIYGDGRQVRDILFVEDLVDAFLLAQEKMPRLRGQAFNIGGGARNTASLVELVDRIALLHRRRPEVIHGAWRTGDQRYYVSDHGKFSRAAGWQPLVSAAEGVARLYHWLAEQRQAEARPAVAARQRAVAGRNATQPAARAEALPRVSVPT
ncbi:MAG TPA: NAD-dependent epimerase/dehydratase family protein [Stellaceae bacterium]